jgi:hypothetical protein
VASAASKRRARCSGFVGLPSDACAALRAVDTHGVSLRIRSIASFAARFPGVLVITDLNIRRVGFLAKSVLDAK